MKKEPTYENYPFWIVILSNLFSIAIYLTGAFIIYRLSLIWMILYVLFIVVLELQLISRHCVDCYYYGKSCAAGKGRISRLFFKKGNNKNFCKKEMSWKDMLPTFLVSLIPLAVGIIIMIMGFSWLMLILVILLFLLTFAGNAAMHTQLICKYCKQRKLGCPADKLFDKDKRDNRNKKK